MSTRARQPNAKDVRTFFRTLQASEVPAAIYWLGGEETFLLDEALQMIVRKAFPDGGEDLGRERFDASESESTTILQAAGELPMFSARRLLVVDNAHQIPARDLKVWQAYAEDPNPSTVLVLRLPATGKSRRRDGATKVQKTLMALAGENALQLDGLSESDVRDWLAGRRARHWRLTLEPEAVELMLALQGTDLRQLDHALERIDLLLGSGSDRRVDAACVMNVLHAGRQHTVFELTDALRDRDLERAMTVLHRLLDESDPIALSFHITRLARQLRILSAPGADRLPPHELSQMAGCPGFQLDRLRRASRRWPEGRLDALLRASRRTEVELRSSRTPRALLLERLVFAFCDDSAWAR